MFAEADTEVHCQSHFLPLFLPLPKKKKRTDPILNLMRYLHPQILDMHTYLCMHKHTWPHTSSPPDQMTSLTIITGTPGSAEISGSESGCMGSS